MKFILKSAAALCLLLFSILFLLTFKMPKALEKSAEGFIKTQIESEIVEMVLKEKLTSSVNKTLKLGEKLGLKFKEESTQKLLEQILPDLIENIVSYKISGNTEESGFKKFAQSSQQYLSKFDFGKKKLTTLIEEKYEEVSKNLKTDIRIFAGLNVLMFFILLLLFFQKQHAKELLLPSVLLFASTLISSSFYIFGQDWLYTIMYNNYMGFGYLVYVLLIFLFLVDAAYNEGEITLFIIDCITNIMELILKLFTAFFHI